MTILLLTSPPGAGKNTIAAAFARLLDRCAVIDVDLLRWMVLQPHKAPWDGAEGARQQQLGVLNACALARNFQTYNFPVVIHDIVSAETATVYRQELSAHGLKIILLLPAFDEVRRRNDSRPARLTAAEIHMLYQSQSALRDYDFRIDNTTLSADDVATQLRAIGEGR